MLGMTSIGYALSSEEHEPRALVEHTRLAEARGFSFALISDHFHPWIGRQGQSPFVWGVLGAIAAATDRIVLGTGVTCPTIRIHPAIIAQAAATAASLMPGRFFLGVGTGERLNEHVLGEPWPEWEVRSEMLEEAVEVIRALWSGEVTSHHGRYYTVENARIYTLPRRPAADPRRRQRPSGWPSWLAGSVTGSSAPGRRRTVVDAYRQAGGDGRDSAR